MHVLKPFCVVSVVCVLVGLVVPHSTVAQIATCDLTVTTTADSGEGSLRAAIQCANSLPGPDRITFAIPGPGPHLIQLNSPLPPVTETAIVDGSSQAGAHPNTQTGKLTDAEPSIEIRGQPGIDFGLVIAADDCVVRGLAVNSFASAGLRILGNRAVIQGNFVGVDAAGALPLPNLFAGILVDGMDHLIGGNTPATRNLIAANQGPGILLQNELRLPANRSKVQGNVIGLGRSGVALANLTGILVNDATHIEIGGTEPEKANIVSGNRGAGVVIAGSNAWASAVGNAIDQNGGLGIDLQARSGPLIGDGVTKEDPLDVDVGPNTLLNSPILIDDITTPSSTFVVGCLHSKAGATFYIDLYAVDQCDPSGRGEGWRYLGRVITQANKLWNADFTLQVSPPLTAGTYVTATATTEDGRTSEFSPCRRISGNPNSSLGKLAVGITASPSPVTVGTPLSYTLSVTNLGPGTVDEVVLANQFPSGLSNVVIRIGHDRCMLADGTLTCSVGTLTHGQVVSLLIEGVPTHPGAYLDTLTATGISNIKPLDPVTTTLETLAVDQPVLTLTDTTVTEGPGALATFTVSLSRPSTVPVTVTWGTVDGTAKAGSDFVGATGQTLTFAPGETTKTLSIPILDDATAESPEQFIVRLSDASHAQIGKADGLAQLIDNDQRLLTADIAIHELAGPVSVLVGQAAIYNLTVTNRGPEEMEEVFLTNSLPPGTRVVSITVHGTNAPCVATNDQLICAFGTLKAADSLPIRITFIPEITGTMTNRFVIAGVGANDPDVSNNSSEILTPVRETPSDDLIASFETEMELNRQTGLLEQRLKVTNNGTTPKPRVRILFNDLPAGAEVYNSAGQEEGTPFVQLNETLQPGESRELLLEYYLPRRAKIPHPRLTLRTGGGPLPVVAEGTSIDVSRTVALSASRFLLEFISNPGKLYQVQYSDDGARTWKRAQPAVRAVNNRYQWLDDGPPKTDTAPAATPARLYRVFTVPE